MFFTSERKIDPSEHKEKRQICFYLIRFSLIWPTVQIDITSVAAIMRLY